MPLSFRPSSIYSRTQQNKNTDDTSITHPSADALRDTIDPCGAGLRETSELTPTHLYSDQFLLKIHIANGYSQCSTAPVGIVAVFSDGSLICSPQIAMIYGPFLE